MLVKMLLDNHLEAQKHAGLVAVANLAAAYLNAGQPEQASALIKQVNMVSMQNSTSVTPDKPAIETSRYTPKEQLENGKFLVLETRKTNAGGVRAYCVGEDNKKVAIYAKNYVGDALEASVNHWIGVNYRTGDKGLIAFNLQKI